MSLEGQVVEGVLPTPLQDLVIAGQDTHRILMSSGTRPGPWGLSRIISLNHHDRPGGRSQFDPHITCEETGTEKSH